MFKLTGKVKLVNSTVQVSDKFAKREFVVTETSSMYPQDILFQSTQDKCSLLDAFTPGDDVEVSFNLRGREWTSPQGEIKYFNTLEAWRIEKVGAPMNQGIPQGGPSPVSFEATTPANTGNNIIESSSENTDLPF